MAENFSVELKGIDELKAKLQGLGLDLQKKGGRFALRKAANIVRDAAISNALSVNDPKTKEEIAKNIVVR